MWPFIDEVHRFDFEMDPEDEYMVSFPSILSTGFVTPVESELSTGSEKSAED